MSTYSWKYPSSDLDRPRNLLATLGSFWNDLYAGRDQLLSFTAARAQTATQTMQDLMALVQAVSRYTVPIYHKDNWYALRLRRTAMNEDTSALLHFDTGAVYDGAYHYDVPRERAAYSFPVPADLAACRLVMNRFTEPSLVWHAGIDYKLDAANGAIIFRTNPFEDARVATAPVFENGVVVDQEAVLWLFRGDFDWDTVYQQFGYVLGMRLKSSRGYRDLLNAVFDAITGGCAGRQIELGLSALTGIPLVLETRETVETISEDAANLLILTDQHVYKFARGDTPTVQAGDTVYAGQSLTTALRIDELNRGEVPAGLRALALGKGMLTSCFYQDLIFENRDVPLEVLTDDPSGFTKLRFALGGIPADVEHFFHEMHARGVEEATWPVDECNPGPAVIVGDPCDPENPRRLLRRGTLAHLLDVRPNPIGEPGPGSLPRTINPLQFLIQNVLRHNAFVVRVRASLLGPGLVGLYHARWLRRLCPPHTALLLVIELTPQAEAIGPEQVGESVSRFTGMNPIQESVPENMVGERISLRLLSGTCQ